MRETLKRAAVLSILLVAGCAYTPTDVSELQLTARDGGLVYYAALRRDSPAVVTITGEIDRRVYTGMLELTRILFDSKTSSICWLLFCALSRDRSE